MIDDRARWSAALLEQGHLLAERVAAIRRNVEENTTAAAATVGVLEEELNGICMDFIALQQDTGTTAAVAEVIRVPSPTELSQAGGRGSML